MTELDCQQKMGGTCRLMEQEATVDNSLQDNSTNQENSFPTGKDSARDDFRMHDKADQRPEAIVQGVSKDRIPFKEITESTCEDKENKCPPDAV